MVVCELSKPGVVCHRFAIYLLRQGENVVYELEVLVRCGVIPEVTRVSAELPIIPSRGDRVVVQTQRGIELGDVLQILSSRPVLAANSIAQSVSSTLTAETPPHSNVADRSPESQAAYSIGDSTTAVLDSAPAAHEHEHNHGDGNDDNHSHEHDHNHESDAAADTERILRRATRDDLAKFAELTARARREFPQWLRWITQWKLNIELLDSEWLLEGNRLVLYVLSGRGPETTQLALQAATVGFDNVDVQPVTTEGRAPRQSGGGCGTGGGGCGCSH